MPNSLDTAIVKANLQMNRGLWIDSIRNVYGEDAAHWFSQGMGVECELARQYCEALSKVDGGTNQ